MQSGLLTDSFSREQVASLPKMIGGAVRLILLSRIESQFGLARRIGADCSASSHYCVRCGGSVDADLGHYRRHCRWPLTQQVDGWIGAASLQLSAADLQKISNAIAGPGAGGGPTMLQLEHAPPAH
jgi:hypothetical protein